MRLNQGRTKPDTANIASGLAKRHEVTKVPRQTTADWETVIPARGMGFLNLYAL